MREKSHESSHAGADVDGIGGWHRVGSVAACSSIFSTSQWNGGRNTFHREWAGASRGVVHSWTDAIDGVLGGLGEAPGRLRCTRGSGGSSWIWRFEPGTWALHSAGAGGCSCRLHTGAQVGSSDLGRRRDGQRRRSVRRIESSIAGTAARAHRNFGSTGSRRAATERGVRCGSTAGVSGQCIDNRAEAGDDKKTLATESPEPDCG